MKRPKNYAQYIASPVWQERRDRFFQERFPFPKLPRCDQCGCYFVELEAHHLTYKNFRAELPEDVLFVCCKCHRNLDRERAARERELAIQRRVEKRRRAIRQFKHPFKQMCRQGGRGDAGHVCWLYRHFAKAWRECRDASYGADIRLEDARRWFLRVNGFMRRQEGRFWFTRIGFELSAEIYCSYLDERKQLRGSI